MGISGWVGGVLYPRSSPAQMTPVGALAHFPIPVPAPSLEGVGGVHMQTPTLGPQGYQHRSLDPALC